MSDPVTLIENYCPRFHFLPPTESYDGGIRLVPGKNNVPNAYMDELLAHECDKVNKAGKVVGTRFPGRELIAQLEVPVVIHTHNGSKVSAQICVFPAGSAAEAEGPTLPATLDGYSDTAALEIVKRTNDKVALARWEKAARGDLKKAVSDRRQAL